jgi:hypothetical protein
MGIIPGRGIIMKITVDVNSVNRRVPEVNSGKSFVSAAKPENRNSDSRIQNEVSKGLQRERAQIDALIIAQVSRDLIQKAITVSARLQSVAIEAFTTGEVDTFEVRKQVSFIEADIADYGGVMASSVKVPLPEPAGKRTDLNKEFGRLKNSGQEILAGEKIDPRVFETISGNLLRESDVLGKSIDNFYSGFRTAIVGSTGTEESAAAGKKLSASIADNPAQALTAQGNLNPEAAGNLVMA